MDAEFLSFFFFFSILPLWNQSAEKLKRQGWNVNLLLFIMRKYTQWILLMLALSSLTQIMRHLTFILLNSTVFIEHTSNIQFSAFYIMFWRRKWQPTPIFCLENAMDRGAWQATVHGVSKELDMTEWLNNKQYKVYVMLNTHIVYLIQKAIKYSFLSENIELLTTFRR